MEYYKKDFQRTGGTSDKMLMVLKMRGSQSASELAMAFDITTEGARLHLLKLTERGLVKSETISKGVGRPVVLFSLTEKGVELFPDTHAELTVQLLHSIKSELGEEALNKLISAREKEMTVKYLQVMAKQPKLESKLDSLVKIRSAEGYMAEWKKTEEGYLFIENHCPICAAATECQGFCRAELNNFRKILGERTTVERVEHIVKGARRCAYLIKE